jgi:hypothetical protein
MSEQDRFAEFLNTLRARVNDRCLGTAEESAGVLPAGFREQVFTEVMLETLEDLGQIAGAELCFFERRIGTANGKVNAWYFDEQNASVDLFATMYRGLGNPASVTKTDLSNTVARAAHVFTGAQKGFYRQMEPASVAYDMMQQFHEVSRSVDRVRVIVFVDGISPKAEISPVFHRNGTDLQVDIWDLQRLFRAMSSGLPYEAIEIDLVERFGAPLRCLSMPESSADYRCYLAIIPGTALHELYDEFGPRLLELNVRSFLQTRVKVNKGIRDTIRSEPARFLAYNNGISATAEDVDITTADDGSPAIRKITGLQVVNGGQTMASIHWAKKRDRADLSEVYVQAKITIVRPEHIETLVPLVSRYANTQNRINEADFSANHPFHVRLQQLSETIWTPGEQSRWFYERARGQYQVARAKEGDTPARLRRFDTATSRHQSFDKVALAKYCNAWDQLPHITSRGSQKSFVHFMERLAKQHPSGWVPDPEYYRKLIARALIYQAAEKIARQHGFPSYRANAVVYTVSLLANRTRGRLDLERIWNQQHVPEAVLNAMRSWMLPVYDEIVTSAGNRNVTEWCKKEECWSQIQTLSVATDSDLEQELATALPLPTVGNSDGRRGENLTSSDHENIARVMQVTPAEWIEISGWGSQTGNLKDWQIGIATTLASYAAGGWSKVPSRKQAVHAVEILRVARAERNDATAEGSA